MCQAPRNKGLQRPQCVSCSLHFVGEENELCKVKSCPCYPAVVRSVRTRVSFEDLGGAVLGLLVAQMVKCLSTMQETWV